MAATMRSGSIVRRIGSMSANTGRAPVIMIARAVYAAESGAVITSSPGPMPSARNVSAMASVPLPTPTACAAPAAAANSASNASTSGPSTNQPRAITRSIARLTSGASSPGASDMKGICLTLTRAPCFLRHPRNGASAGGRTRSFGRTPRRGARSASSRSCA